MADTLSSQIYVSRDSIRTQVSDLLKNYLELENVDLTKSSFLSFTNIYHSGYIPIELTK